MLKKAMKEDNVNKDFIKESFADYYKLQYQLLKVSIEKAPPIIIFYCHSTSSQITEWSFFAMMDAIKQRF